MQHEVQSLQVEPTFPPGFVTRCKNGKFNFSATGGKVYFITTFGAIRNCSTEEEGAGSWDIPSGWAWHWTVPEHSQWSPGQGQLLQPPQPSLYPKISFIRQRRVEKWHKWAMSKTGQSPPRAKGEGRNFWAGFGCYLRTTMLWNYKKVG